MRLNPGLIHRREALAAIAGVGRAGIIHRRAQAAAVLDTTTATCVSPSPALEEGPFFIEEKLLRSDIRTDPATGVAQPGVLLTLSVNVQNQIDGVCGPLAGAYIDVWHANWDGVYSDEAQERTSGQKYLRGYQIADDSGNVQFTTVYPGWYSGRAVHIHLRVRTYSGMTVQGDFETQAFFDEPVTSVVHF